MANSVETLYEAKTGLVSISTANSNLDGSGTISTVLSGATNGTLVKTLIIKAQTDTSEGMIRLFAKKPAGTNTLIAEYYVPPITKSARDLSFYRVINLNYLLEFEEQLNVATQIANTFNVIAEAFDISYSASVNFIGSSLENTSNSGVTKVSVANGNLDGTGAVQNVITAASSGTAIKSITIKAQQTTSPGMIRLFIDDGSGTKYLFCEVIVPSVVQSASTPSFSYQVIGQGTLCLQSGFKIAAATQNGERFSIVAEGADWQYV